MWNSRELMPPHAVLGVPTRLSLLALALSLFLYRTVCSDLCSHGVLLLFADLDTRVARNTGQCSRFVELLAARTSSSFFATCARFAT